MATLVLTDCKLYLAGYDLSGAVNQLGLTHEAEIKDQTTFASAGFREKVAGLKTVTMEHNGLWDAGTGTVDDALFTAIGAAEQPVSVAPLTGADGELAYIFRSLVASYAPGASIGEILAFTVRGEGQGDLVRGTIMATGTKTVTGTGTARNLGQVASGKKLYAALHVLAASGTGRTLDVTVESDDASGFLTPATRITFAQATATGGQWATPVAGPITDTWWRVAWTIGGTTPSFTFAVVVGIQ